jgi:hypothetical protein
MNYLININNKKRYTVVSVFIAIALVSALIVLDNSTFAQPFSFNKISQESKAAKCSSGTLPKPACKNFDNQGQVNTGGITTGQTAGGGTSATGGNGSSSTTSTGGATGGSNTANSAISQGQQSTQSCASGTLKLLPHSSLSCTNTANQGQVNTGGITTGQTAGGGTATQ